MAPPPSLRGGGFFENFLRGDLENFQKLLVARFLGEVERLLPKSQLTISKSKVNIDISRTVMQYDQSRISS